VKLERLSPWLLSLRGPGRPRVRVFCFPHAGGGASTYRRWAAELADGVEICAVQLPGREDRLNEPPFNNLTALVAAVHAEIVQYVDRPFAFFGHSMGALVGFELTRTLQANGDVMPLHVVVSGRRAPHLPPIRQPLHDLPPGQFEAALLALEGTPGDVFADKELMALLGPLLRADLAVCETYEYAPGDPLDVPLTVFGGSSDAEASAADLEAWRIHSRAFCGLQLFPGNHFYFRERPREIVAAIERVLELGLVQLERQQPDAVSRRWWE
jgi:medium-chain acyl-[acyl-carrier-protein] hydrolase